MKKILSIMFAALMVVSCISMAGCGAKETNLKFGMGVYSVYDEATDADGEVPGTCGAAVTAAIVLVDEAGKIVKCAIDTTENSIGFSAEGKSLAAGEYKTKGELGNDYGMKAYGGATKEWFEQRDAFCKLTEGKTLDEVKALLVDGYKGNDEVIAAGCTIGIADFVYAVEKAVANIADSAATAKDTLSLGFVSVQDKVKDASDEGDGSLEVVVNICGAVVNGDAKAVLTESDSVAVKFSFSADGKSTTDTTAAIASKRELGTGYNMAAYGTDLNGDGVVKEWFEQADAFDAACAGKTAEEISALVVEGYGVDSLKTAGCTIGISDMAEAAVKAVK